MQNCEHEYCCFPATVAITFTDGSTEEYCNTHGANFDPSIIESCELIKNDIFQAILARLEANRQASI